MRMHKGVFMPKILQSGIKMGVGILLYSLAYSQYLRLETILSILFVYLGGWCIWLWVVGHGWRWRLLATLGFALMPFGYWVVMELITSFAQERFAIGNLLIIVGIGVLTYADYHRTAGSQPKLTLPKERDAVDDRVWPPAPKKPSA